MIWVFFFQKIEFRVIHFILFNFLFKLFSITSDERSRFLDNWSDFGRRYNQELGSKWKQSQLRFYCKIKNSKTRIGWLVQLIISYKINSQKNCSKVILNPYQSDNRGVVGPFCYRLRVIIDLYHSPKIFISSLRFLKIILFKGKQFDNDMFSRQEGK